MSMVMVGAGLLVAGLMASAQASVPTLSENFDNFASLGAGGWVIANSSVGPNLSWFAGNSGVFGAQSGADGSYAAASFTSTSGFPGAIDNWLISPALNVGASATPEFYTRGEDAGFFDMHEVRFSGGAGSAVSGFTTLLASVGSDSAASYPVGGWVQYTLTLPTAQSGRIAFRCVNADASNADCIGVDTVSVTTVPEPATMALTAWTLAAVAGTPCRQKPDASQQPST